MLRNVEAEDRPQPWLTKKKPVARSTRGTRASAKANPGNDNEDETLLSNLASGSARGRRKGKSKKPESAKGMKKTQSMNSAAVAVVLGLAENTVPNVKEMCRKTEEDERACGRITRTVSNPAKRKSCPTTTAYFSASADPEENNSPHMSCRNLDLNLNAEKRPLPKGMRIRA